MGKYVGEHIIEDATLALKAKLLNEMIEALNSEKRKIREKE